MDLGGQVQDLNRLGLHRLDAVALQQGCARARAHVHVGCRLLDMTSVALITRLGAVALQQSRSAARGLWTPAAARKEWGCDRHNPGVLARPWPFSAPQSIIKPEHKNSITTSSDG